MKIKITSDSTIDLTPDLIRKYGIGIMPLTVLLGEEAFSDGVDVTPDMLYAYAERTGELPKTACRNADEYAEFFASFLDEYDAVLHISLSSGISSSYDQAAVAADRFGGRVRAVDSLALSTGTALLAIDAAERADEAGSLDELAERVLRRVPAVQTSFIVDRLEYLYKGGRCSKLQLLGSNMLKIKPTIEMRDGALFVGKKFRGRLEYTVADYVNDILDRFDTPDLTRIFVTHTEISEEIADMVKQAIAARYPFREILDTTAGATITSHCGRGTIGILYLNDGETR